MSPRKTTRTTQQSPAQTANSQNHRPINDCYLKSLSFWIVCYASKLTNTGTDSAHCRNLVALKACSLSVIARMEKKRDFLLVCSLDLLSWPFAVLFMLTCRAINQHCPLDSQSPSPQKWDPWPIRGSGTHEGPGDKWEQPRAGNSQGRPSSQAHIFCLLISESPNFGFGKKSVSPGHLSSCHSLKLEPGSYASRFRNTNLPLAKHILGLLDKNFNIKH